jgi:hypothetical protein
LVACGGVRVLEQKKKKKHEKQREMGHTREPVGGVVRHTKRCRKLPLQTGTYLTGDRRIPVELRDGPVRTVLKESRR